MRLLAARNCRIRHLPQATSCGGPSCDDTTCAKRCQRPAARHTRLSRVRTERRRNASGGCMRSGVWVTLVLSLLIAVPAASQTSPGPQTQSDSGPQLESVLVTGSRIPRPAAPDAGPAPVVTITSADILQRGFTDMSDVMRNLNQNLGSLDNNTATDGFSPGAQAVDLRGMGPNHTLVLINGRRIADYPQAYGD